MRKDRNSNSLLGSGLGAVPTIIPFSLINSNSSRNHSLGFIGFICSKTANETTASNLIFWLLRVSGDL